MGHTNRLLAASLSIAFVLHASVPVRLAAQERNKVPAADWMTQRPATYSIVLQIERGSNRGERPIDARLAAAVCESTAVVDPVITAATQLPLAEARQLVLVEAEPSNEAFVTIKVTLSPAATQRLPEGVGTTVLRELADRASTVLTKSAQLQMAPLQEQRDRLDARLEEAEKAYAYIDARYKESAGRVEPMNNMGRLSVRPEFERQRAQLAQLIAGSRARLAVLETSAPATRPAADARGDSPAVQLSTQLIELRERSLATTKEAVDAGQANAAALVAAQERVIEARLLAALAELNGRPRRGFEGSGDPNADNVISLRARIAEHQAQMETLEAQLAATPEPATQPTNLMSQNDFQALAQERQEARSRVQSARQQRESFDQQYGNLKPPTITPLKVD